jgi:cytochrome c
MKKVLITLTIFTALIACNSAGDKKEGDKKEGGGETAAADITQHPDYKKGLALVAKDNCFTCHKVDDVVTGPSYKDVAKKYAGASDEKIAELAQTIIKGGKGVWGETYMTPHASLSEEDAKAMVKYILLLK